MSIELNNSGHNVLQDVSHFFRVLREEAPNNAIEHDLNIINVGGLSMRSYFLAAAQAIEIGEPGGIGRMMAGEYGVDFVVLKCDERLETYFGYKVDMRVTNDIVMLIDFKIDPYNQVEMYARWNDGKGGPYQSYSFQEKREKIPASFFRSPDLS